MGEVITVSRQRIELHAKRQHVAWEAGESATIYGLAAAAQRRREQACKVVTRQAILFWFWPWLWPVIWQDFIGRRP